MPKISERNSQENRIIEAGKMGVAPFPQRKLL
jgi:hypothetical protein